jgi:hypothetical protein
MNKSFGDYGWFGGLLLGVCADQSIYCSKDDKQGHAFPLQRIRLDLIWLGFLALIGGLLSSLGQICNKGTSNNQQFSVSLRT